MAQLQCRRDQLDVDPAEVGTDHVRPTEAGEAIAECDGQLAEVEEPAQAFRQT